MASKISRAVRRRSCVRVDGGLALDHSWPLWDPASRLNLGPGAEPHLAAWSPVGSKSPRFGPGLCWSDESGWLMEWQTRVKIGAWPRTGGAGRWAVGEASVRFARPLPAWAGSWGCVCRDWLRGTKCPLPCGQRQARHKRDGFPEPRASRL